MAASPEPDDTPGGTPLPPAVTQWTVNHGNDRGAQPVPPFFIGNGDTVKPAASVPASSSSEPKPHPYAPLDDADVMPWDTMDEEGIVEAVFEEDVAVTTEEILANAREPFPVDAFMIPEDARRVPTGMDQATVDAVKHHTEHPVHDAAHDLSDRFEKLSRRLRAEPLDTIIPSLARGDRFDALLAGFLAGYFSAREG